MTFTNLKTLTPSPSILNNIELFEPIDYNKLNKLLNSKLIKNSSDWNETKQLSKYIKNYNSKTGLVKVKYTRNDLIEFGRVNPEFNLGLHTIRREIRHTISNDYLMDIDMVNCHPVKFVKSIKCLVRNYQNMLINVMNILMLSNKNIILVETKQKH
jgi:hypothetical protein